MTLPNLSVFDDAELLDWLRDRIDSVEGDESSARLVEAETDLPQIIHAAYSRENTELQRAALKLQQALEAKRRPASLPPHTGHFVSGDRLIYIVDLPRGGREVMAYDWDTGRFVRDLSYLGEDDLERVDATEFRDRLRRLRGS